MLKRDFKICSIVGLEPQESFRTKCFSKLSKISTFSDHHHFVRTVRRNCRNICLS